MDGHQLWMDINYGWTSTMDGHQLWMDINYGWTSNMDGHQLWMDIKYGWTSTMDGHQLWMDINYGWTGNVNIPWHVQRYVDVMQMLINVKKLLRRLTVVYITVQMMNKCWKDISFNNIKALLNTKIYLLFPLIMAGWFVIHNIRNYAVVISHRTCGYTRISCVTYLNVFWLQIVTAGNTS